jgi:tripartite-type tricarboxylate transporter receptor subunit TctC
MSKNDIQQKFMEQGFVTLTSTPEDFDRTLKAQLENFKTLINDLGLRTD